jgi:hypothetical protein
MGSGNRADQDTTQLRKLADATEQPTQFQQTLLVPDGDGIARYEEEYHSRVCTSDVVSLVWHLHD